MAEEEEEGKRDRERGILFVRHPEQGCMPQQKFCTLTTTTTNTIITTTTTTKGHR